MSVARKIAYNAAVNAVAKVLSTVLALVSIGFITRYLGVAGFGNYALSLTFFSFFGALADLGLYSVVTREISRRGADEKTILGNIFALRLLISSCVLMFAGATVWLLPYTEEVKVAILFSALGFLFSSSYSVLNGVFQKNLVMDRVAMVELAGKMLQLVCIAIIVQVNAGFLAVMGAFSLNMLFNFVGVFWISRKLVVFHLTFDFTYWKRFLRESLPVGVSAIVTFLYFKFDTVLLSLLQDETAVGVYSGAYKIIENLVFFPSMVVGLVLPLFSKYIFEKRETFALLADKVFKVFALIVFPLAVGVWFTAEQIVSIVGGPDFVSSGPVLRVLVFALGCVFFGNLFNAVLLAGNRQKDLMYILSGCAVINLTLNFFVISRYSYIGAAYTSVLTEALVMLAGAYLCSTHLQYRPQILSLWRILVPTCAMGGTLFLLHPVLGFLPLVVVAVGVYAGGAVLTNAVTKSEIGAIFSRKKALSQI